MMYFQNFIYLLHLNPYKESAALLDILNKNRDAFKTYFKKIFVSTYKIMF